MINPYAPKQRAGAAEEDPGPRRGVLPVMRLGRLGASRRMLDALGGMWADLSEDERAAMADEMADLSDDALMERLVGEAPGGDVDEVAAWVQAHPFPPDAARAAIAAEQARDDPNLAAIDRYARTGG